MILDCRSTRLAPTFSLTARITDSWTGVLAGYFPGDRILPSQSYLLVTFAVRDFYLLQDGHRPGFFDAAVALVRSCAIDPGSVQFMRSVPEIGAFVYWPIVVRPNPPGLNTWVGGARSCCYMPSSFSRSPCSCLNCFWRFSSDFSCCASARFSSSSPLAPAPAR